MRSVFAVLALGVVVAACVPVHANDSKTFTIHVNGKLAPLTGQPAVSADCVTTVPAGASIEDGMKDCAARGAFTYTSTVFGGSAFVSSIDGVTEDDIDPSGNFLVSAFWALYTTTVAAGGHDLVDSQASVGISDYYPHEGETVSFRYELVVGFFVPVPPAEASHEVQYLP